MHVRIEEKLPIDRNEIAKDTLEAAPGDMTDPLWGARVGREAVSCGVPPMHIAGHRMSTHRRTDIERSPSE